MTPRQEELYKAIVEELGNPYQIASTRLKYEKLNFMDYEKDMLLALSVWAYRAKRHNITRAAESIGMNRNRLGAYIKQAGDVRLEVRVRY
jgi:uncharacterized protein (UPF0128 family)